MAATSLPTTRPRVPVRTIAATITMVLLTALALLLLYTVRQILSGLSSPPSSPSPCTRSSAGCSDG